MKNEKLTQVGLSLLRISLGILFIAFAIMQLQNPAVWTGFVPEGLGNILDPRLLVLFNAAAEIVLGIILILGVYTRIVALLLALHLFAIAFSLGFSPTGLRDFGLAFATLALALVNPTSSIHEKVKSMKRAVKGVLLLLALIVFVVVFTIGSSGSRPAEAAVEPVPEPEPIIEADLDVQAQDEKEDTEMKHNEAEMKDMMKEMIDEEGVDPHSHAEDFPNISAIKRKADAILSEKEQSTGGSQVKFIYHNTYYEASIDANGNTIDIHADDDSH